MEGSSVVTTYTYLFVDILTNKVVNELPCYGTWFSRQLNGSGQMTATVAMNTAQYTNQEIKGSTVPGKMALYALRDDAVVWSGPIWSRTYNSQGSSLQLSGQTWESWLNKFYPPASLRYTSTEQRNIAIDLISDMQAVPQQNALFTLPSNYPNQIVRTENFPFEDLKSYGELIEYLSEYDTGFDYEIIGYMDSNGVLQRYVNFGNPQLGRVQGQSGLIFDYPTSITDYYYTENAADGAVKVWGVGGPPREDAAPIRSSYTQSDIAALGNYPLLQSVFTNGDVTSQITLDAQTKLFGNSKRSPVVGWTINVDPTVDPVIGTWQLGDQAHVTIEDQGFFEDDPFSGYVRVIGWEWNPAASDSVETLKLSIEGSDDSAG
jgi:hypothetical protein